MPPLAKLLRFGSPPIVKLRSPFRKDPPPKTSTRAFVCATAPRPANRNIDTAPAATQHLIAFFISTLRNVVGLLTAFRKWRGLSIKVTTSSSRYKARLSGECAVRHPWGVKAALKISQQP